MNKLRSQLKDCEVGDYCPLRLSASTQEEIHIAMPRDPKSTIEDLKKADKQGLIPTQTHTGMPTDEWVFRRSKEIDGGHHEWVWKRIA